MKKRNKGEAVNSTIGNLLVVFNPASCAALSGFMAAKQDDMEGALLFTIVALACAVWEGCQESRNPVRPSGLLESFNPAAMAGTSALLATIYSGWYNHHPVGAALCAVSAAAFSTLGGMYQNARLFGQNGPR